VGSLAPLRADRRTTFGRAKFLRLAAANPDTNEGPAAALASRLRAVDRRAGLLIAERRAVLKPSVYLVLKPAIPPFAKPDAFGKFSLLLKIQKMRIAKRDALYGGQFMARNNPHRSSRGSAAECSVRRRKAQLVNENHANKIGGY